jgi:hypothetical protein
MAIDRKILSGGLDYDTQRDLVASNDYIDALNIEFENGVINLSGNKLITSPLTDNTRTYKVVGSYEDLTNQYVYFFVHSRVTTTSAEATGYLLRYRHINEDVKIIAEFPPSFLRDSSFVHSINVITREDVLGDIIMWLDQDGVPRKMNIKYAEDSTLRQLHYSTALGSEIPLKYLTAGKRMPVDSPSVSYADNPTSFVNNLNGKLFQFRYRWVYGDGEKSSWSPYSAVVTPRDYQASGTYSDPTKNNTILLNYNTGDSDVRIVEVGVRISEGSNVFGQLYLVDTINKPAANGTLSFTNDGVYTIEDEREAVSLFDYTPKMARAQELVNGNVVTYGGITEGYNRHNTAMVVSAIPFSFQPISNNIKFQPFATVPSVGRDIDVTLVPDWGTLIPSGYTFSVSFDYDYVTPVQSNNCTEWKLENTDPNWYIDVKYQECSDGEFNIVRIFPLDFIVVCATNGNVPILIATEGNNFLSGDFVATTQGACGGGGGGGTTLTRNSITVSYTTVSSDSFSNVLLQLKTKLSAVVVSTFGANHFDLIYDATPATPKLVNIKGVDNSPSSNVFFVDLVSATITAPTAASSVDDSTPSWKWAGKYRLGIVYLDSFGRTNGVMAFKDFDIPKYAEEISGAPKRTEVDISITSTAPSWATNYQIVRSKELLTSRFLHWNASDTKLDGEYVYFNIDSLTTYGSSISGDSDSPIINYSFATGDRVRIMKNTSDNTVFSTDNSFEVVGDLINPKIGGVTVNGRFLKVRGKNISGVTAAKKYLIEIYTPSKRIAVDDTFMFEFGVGGTILTGGLHSGNTQNQTNLLPANIKIRLGDVYTKNRIFPETAPFTHAVQDSNFSDFFNSSINSNGRPFIYDPNERERFLKATVRFSLEIVGDSLVNGLNKFYFDNREDGDIRYGSIVRIRQRDRYLRIFQELKCGAMPVLQNIILDVSGDSTLGLSERLLNNIQYYSGDYGIGNAVKSLVSEGFVDYIVDPAKGVILRLSNDGITPLSITYKIDAWAKKNLTGATNIVGVYDRARDTYKLFARNRAGVNVSITFDEAANRFKSHLSYVPEDGVAINDTFVTFKGRHCYLHPSPNTAGVTQPAYCNFYGTQADSYITPIFNSPTGLKKIFHAHSSVSEGLWFAKNLKTSTGQLSNLVVGDYVNADGLFAPKNFESVHHASLKRASNSNGGLHNGEQLRGTWLEAAIYAESPSTKVSLQLTDLKYIESNLNR